MTAIGMETFLSRPANAAPTDAERAATANTVGADMMISLRCAAHRQGPAISPEAVAVLQDILGGRLGTALNEVRGPVVGEVDHLTVRALEHHLERRLRSVTTFHRG